ncbi:MAG: hypothetical protein WCT19_03665 [Candidatus Paceibacterota bacterium]|jgi:hypothetical protein
MFKIRGISSDRLSKSGFFPQIDILAKKWARCHTRGMLIERFDMLPTKINATAIMFWVGFFFFNFINFGLTFITGGSQFGKLAFGSCAVLGLVFIAFVSIDCAYLSKFISSVKSLDKFLKEWNASTSNGINFLPKNEEEMENFFRDIAVEIARRILVTEVIDGKMSVAAERSRLYLKRLALIVEDFDFSLGSYHDLFRGAEIKMKIDTKS